MSRLEQLGERDGWRCWLCDEPVDPRMSVNDPRGPSTDSIVTKAKSRGAPAQERLAHRVCNTKKGAVAAVVSWPTSLFLADPAPIIASVDRLQLKGGRVAMCRCSSRDDAIEAGEWLLDRLSRLRPDFAVSTKIEAGGGQFVLILSGA